MIEINGNNLTLDEIQRVARFGEPVAISQRGVRQINASNQVLENIIKTSQPVYGINTGFGIFADMPIKREDASRLSRNLIISHAVGTGEPLPEEIVRAAILVRANTLAKGFSGVRLELVDTLIHLLNKCIIPVIPSQGSLGSSGDLIPLSHMALVFTTDEHDEDNESGFARFNGNIVSGKTAMAQAGIPRITLGPKEGLAVNNGATFSTAIAALAILDANYLLKLADVAISMSLEALLGCSSSFDDRLHQVRGHAGQILVAKNVNQLIEGSSLIKCASRVQDAYSLRCSPQVHGVAHETLAFVRSLIEKEVNAATDNPLIFEGDVALSGGNFHGEPVGFMMDFLGIAMAEIAAISERRIFRLIDGRLNAGLTPMLVDNLEAAGLNSGLMMPQYTAAALVLENQTLAHPDLVHSLPTSGEQEDHNANSMTAARHIRQIVDNTRHVLAIELYTAARALDLRLKSIPGTHFGAGTKKVFDQIRSVVPYRPGDAWWGPEINKVNDLIASQSLFTLN